MLTIVLVQVFCWLEWLGQGTEKILGRVTNGMLMERRDEARG